MPPVTTDDQELAFAQWLQSLALLTGSAEAAKHWRERRYQFAHRLGQALVGETETHTVLSGPALYGIWLTWGLLYVGQTTDAFRRLRDLPIGESHHLANTFPPETWDRVVVINWPALLEADDAVKRLDQKTVGLALEHHLQVRVQPLANAARRTQGEWRPIDRSKSISRGARAAAAVSALCERVDSLWDRAAAFERGATPLPSSTRCVRPRHLV